MRSLLLSTSLLIAPAAALADPPQCALPPAALASAATPPAAPTDSAVSARAVTSAQAADLPGMPPRIGADQIGRVPALQRIASNGAELFDLGREHGLQGVFARHGNAFQVFYITADGQAEIGGVMWSADGKNLTRDRVAPIEGAIPTVTIGAPSAQLAATSTASPPSVAAASVQRLGVSPLEAVRATSFGTVGNATAPKLYVFIDPLCSFSVRAMDQLRPYVASGRVQLAVIPLSVLDYEDQGRSTPVAKAMLSLAPDAMVAAWSGGRLNGPADPAADSRLAANMQAAEAIGLKGTPTFVWRKADGSEGRADGLPDYLDALVASLGS